MKLNQFPFLGHGEGVTADRYGVAGLTGGGVPQKLKSLKASPSVSTSIEVGASALDGGSSTGGSAGRQKLKSEYDSSSGADDASIVLRCARREAS